MKEKIQEIIVVEGRDDTRRLQEVFEVDTIETIGSAINQEILARIAHAEEVRGVIVFTDPDFAGEKIRKTVMEAVPSAKHAFLPKKEGRGKKKYASLGVEHASDEAIKKALAQVVTPTTEEMELIPLADLQMLGLVSGPNAKHYRELLGEKLAIGYTNGKQLQKRLGMFRIPLTEVVAYLKEIQEKEKNHE
ncbi:ribonuclease M5 [Enterococcus nangangensis]|uniref:ribonuclease M5 n=1 Tax=Enterococcus nangangensis TaxID=2559926 RepID=UPI0010F5D4DD|nr:ribonuclease M5 [Enterococcus nangangensis]